MKIIPKLVFFGAAIVLASFTVLSLVVEEETKDHPIMGFFEAAINTPFPKAKLLISLLVLAAALYVILARRYGPKEKHWGYATCGTILGYWLKG